MISTDDDTKGASPLRIALKLIVMALCIICIGWTIHDFILMINPPMSKEDAALAEYPAKDLPQDERVPDTATIGASTFTAPDGGDDPLAVEIPVTITNENERALYPNEWFVVAVSQDGRYLDADTVTKNDLSGQDTTTLRRAGDEWRPNWIRPGDSMTTYTTCGVPGGTPLTVQVFDIYAQKTIATETFDIP